MGQVAMGTIWIANHFALIIVHVLIAYKKWVQIEKIQQRTSTLLIMDLFDKVWEFSASVEQLLNTPEKRCLGLSLGPPR